MENNNQQINRGNGLTPKRFIIYAFIFLAILLTDSWYFTSHNKPGQIDNPNVLSIINDKIAELKDELKKDQRDYINGKFEGITEIVNMLVKEKDETNIDPFILANAGNITSLEITSDNLIRNSSFEAGEGGHPRQWNYILDSTNSNTAQSMEGIRSGHYGLKFSGQTSSNGLGLQYGISQPITKTVPGRTYAFSLYLKTVNIAPGTTLRFGFWDEYNNKYAFMQDVSLSSTKDWYRVSTIQTTPGQITDWANWYPIIEVKDHKEGAIYIDDVLLTEGNVLTAYNSSTAGNKDNVASFLGNGSVLVTSTGTMYPAEDGIGSLGTNTNRWHDLYLVNATINENGDMNLNGDASIGGNLTVNNNATFNGDVTFGGSSSFPNGISVGQNGEFTINDAGNITKINNVNYSFPSSQGSTNEILINDGSGNLSWGTFGAASVTDDSLDFAQFKDGMTVDADTSVNLFDGVGSRYLNFYNSNSLAQLLFLDGSTGFVGIGTTVPGFKLEVNGTTLAGGVLLSSSNVGVTTDTDLLSLANNALTVNGTVTATLPAGGTDSVVTESSGTLQTRTIDSRVWGTSLLDFSGTGNANFISRFSDDNSLIKSAIYQSGTSIGIGKTNPLFTLDVEGDVRVTAGNDFYVDTIGLNDQGVSRTTSGASLIGTFGEFTNSMSTNVQDVLDDLDASITTFSSGAGDIEQVGSMAAGEVFANTDADDQWLGLGSTAGRIEFDNQATDEVNILSANFGIGTSAPSQLLTVGALNQFTVDTSGNLSTTGTLTGASINTGQGAYEIQDASTVNKGLASFNSTNFSVTTGAVSIATNGVGPAELASTGVTAGTYGTAIASGTGYYPIFSVDQDGRLIAASTSPFSFNQNFESVLTFGNGLTRTVNNIALGGSLTGNTRFFTTGTEVFSMSTIGNIGIGTTNTTAARLSVIGGSVGIGTTSPTALLTVGSGNAFTVDNSGNLSTTGTLAGATIDTGNGVYEIQDASTVNKGLASFNTNNFSVSAGAVSIKTDGVGPTELASTAVTSGTYGKALASGTAYFPIFSVDQDGRLISASTTPISFNQNFESVLTFGNGLTRTANNIALGGSLTGNTRFFTTGTEVFSMSTIGNIGIGTTNTTAAKLSVIGGSVGIGTTSPVTPLDVRGTITATGFTCPDCIDAANIAAGAVGTSEIADNTVSSTDILDGTILTGDIGTDTILAGNIAAGAVGTSEIADNTVSSTDILDGTILTGDIGTDTILAGNIAAGAVGTSEIADGTVSSTDILDSTILTGDIAADTILAADIAADAIGDSELFNTGTWTLTGTLNITGGDIGLGISPVVKLDIDTGSNTDGLRLRGLAETTEIADMYVGSGGQLVLATTNGADTDGFIEVDAKDDQYGFIIRDSSTPSSIFANLYMKDSSAVNGDYLYIASGSAVGLGQLGLAINSAANVGIGTTTPSAKLDVVGTVEATDFSCTDCIDAANIATSAVTTTEILDSTIASADIAVDTIAAVDIAAGAVGTSEIADNSITATDIAPDAITSSELAADSVGDSELFNGGNWNLTSSLNLLGSNLGIGGTAPSTVKLRITGGSSTGIFSNSSSNSIYGLTTGSGAGVWGDNTTTDGIGVKATSATGQALYATSSTNNGYTAGYIEATGNGPGLYVLSTSGVALTTDSTSNLGADIYRDSGAAVARFTNSTAACTISPTAGSVSCSSDIRLKKNVSTYENSLAIIQALRGVNFKWKTDTANDPMRIGFIAQEVQKVVPELVNVDEDTGMLSMSYGNLTPILVNAMQDQQDQIDSLKNVKPTIINNTNISNINSVEMYSTQSDIEAGDVVTTGSAYITTKSGQTMVKLNKTSQKYQNSIIGIASRLDKQGNIQNDIKDEDRPYPVANAGKVQVKITAENGNIQPGDLLTSSSTPGRAMKATQAGMVIGEALEKWDPSSGKDKILVSVKNMYYDPEIYYLADGNSFGIKQIDDGYKVQNTNTQDLLTRVGAFDTGYFGNLNVGSLKAQEIILSGVDLSASLSGINLQLKGVENKLDKLAEISDVHSPTEDKLTQQEAKIALLDTKVGNLMNRIDLSKPVATEEADISSLKDRVSFLEKMFAGKEASGSGVIAQVNSDDSDVLGTSTGVLEKLTVTGKTNLFDLGVVGDMSVGQLVLRGKEAVINSLALPLQLQSEATAPVEIMANKVEIDTKGNLKVKETVKAKKYEVDTAEEESASIGEGDLKVGETEIIIKTNSVTDKSRIFLTPTIETDLPLAVVEKIPGKSFKVKVTKTLEKDISFNWWIVN